MFEISLFRFVAFMTAFYISRNCFFLTLLFILASFASEKDAKRRFEMKLTNSLYFD